VRLVGAPTVPMAHTLGQEHNQIERKLEIYGVFGSLPNPVRLAPASQAPLARMSACRGVCLVAWLSAA
jgi:hypothetical protein